VAQSLELLGREAARELKSVLSLVRGPHKEKNAALFDVLETEPPSLQNGSWGEMAFVAGVYAGFMAREPLSLEQRRALCVAIGWAARYENQLRPREFQKRLRQYLTFARQAPSFSDIEDLVVSAIRDIVEVVPPLDHKTLEWLRSEAAALRSDSVATVIDEVIAHRPIGGDTPATTAENEVVATVEQLWKYLDRKREAFNRSDLEKIRQNPTSPDAHAALARLGGFIFRNMLQRLVRRDDELLDAALDAALRISRDVESYSHPDFKARSKVDALMLRAVRDTRRGRVDREAFTAVFEAAVLDDPTTSWSQLAGCVAIELSRRTPNEQTRETMGEWLRVMKPHWTKIDHARQQDLLEQAHRHAPDSILLGELRPTDQHSDSETTAEPLPGMAQLLSAYKRLDLPEIGRILGNMRPHLIAELCRKLSATDPDFNTILRPRRAPKMFTGPRRGNAPAADKFHEASRLLASKDDASKRRGCEMFEEFAESRLPPDLRQVATEWMLYARAEYRGLPLVFSDWQKDLKSKSASWEEIWNLAVFHKRIGDIAAALDVLRTGVESLTAPYSHLRFALYCALQLIETPSAKNDGATASAQRFLIKHLQLHPLPECFLVWVLLVDDAAMNVLPQQRFQVLATFQQLVDEPLALLDPGADHLDNAMDAFRKRLDELHLDKTWLIWINDFTERHPWKPAGYRKLSEALIGIRRDVDSALQRAAEALQRLVDLQGRNYEREKARVFRREGDGPPSGASDQLDRDLRNLRASLKQLFEFYKNYLPATERTTAYKHYSSRPPFKQFWDATEPANNALIHLTRDLIDDGPPPPPPTPPGGEKNDAYIVSALSDVKDVAALRGLLDRLLAWIDARVQGAAIVQQRVNFVKTVLGTVAVLGSKTRTKGELEIEMKRANSDLAKAAEHVAGMRELRVLQPAVVAAQIAFAAFAKMAAMQPAIRATVVSPGVPAAAAETSLILDVENHGPGDVTDLQISCEDSGALIARDVARVQALAEKQNATVAVPVTIVGSGPAINCRVNIRYDAGVLKDLRYEEKVIVPRFDFAGHLGRVRPGAYEIPIPYTEKAIDFNRDDPRLFQGRDAYVEQARAIINGQLKTDPIYYHGVRRVGKSSLLARLELEFKSAGVIPILIKLEGVRAAQQDVNVVINTLTTMVVEAARAFGVQGELKPVSAMSENPVVELIGFFRDIVANFEQRRVALMIDEFHNLVAPTSTAILDVLRRVHQELSVLLFTSGWVRPKQLERDCPDTQLFPLVYRAIDFLSPDAVARVLREPLMDLEIQVPETTVARAYELSAGNPHHLAALAISSLNRLNAEQRICITPDDLEYAADEVVLADGDRYFRTTIFSQMMLTRAERAGSIAFAKLLKDRRAVPIAEASQSLPTDLLDDLREKGIVQVYPDQRVGIRGVLLSRYLAARIAEEPPDIDTSPLLRRVGIFVDVENIRNYLPPGGWEDAAKAIVRYGEGLGRVVCRWAAFDNANFADPTGVRLGLERGGSFLVCHPERLRTEENRKDRADFVLIERIHDELTHTRPEIVVILSGDHGYYAVVSSLINRDIAVRIVAAPDSVSSDFNTLETEIALRRKIDGLEGERFHVDTTLPNILGRIDH